MATSAPSLLIERDRPFLLHAGLNDWRHVRDISSRPLGLGRHGVTIRPRDLDITSLLWTTFDPATGSWEGADHVVDCRPVEPTDDPAHADLTDP